MTITERAEEARREVMEATRGTEYAEVVLKALSLTMAEGWDHGYDQGYESGKKVYANLLSRWENASANISTVR
jgi:flagellar biosynthesis/type III secretory pathway protein FliH